MPLDEAEQPQLVQHRPVVGDPGVSIPLVEDERRVQTGLLRSAGKALAIAALDLVGQQDEQEVLGVHLPVTGLPEPLGQQR